MPGKSKKRIQGYLRSGSSTGFGLLRPGFGCCKALDPPYIGHGGRSDDHTGHPEPASHRQLASREGMFDGADGGFDRGTQVLTVLRMGLTLSASFGLDINAVASYTFLPVEEFRTRLNGTNQSKIIFGALLNPGGTVQFSDFSQNYDLLIEELLLFQDRF